MNPNPEPVDKHVGKMIRHFRWMAGLTQEQLAIQIGCKFQQVQKYETGANRVSASRLSRIADALDRTEQDFFPAHDTDIPEGVGFTRDEIELIKAIRQIDEPVKSRAVSLVHDMAAIK